MASTTVKQLDRHRSFDHDITGFGRDVFLSMLDESRGLHTMDELMSWFTRLKSGCQLQTTGKPLNELDDWIIDEYEIRHVSGDFFTIIAAKVDIGGREVAHWTQPLIAHPRAGLIGFLAQKFNGIMHFLVHAHSEPGAFDLMEMSPTVICSDPRRTEARPDAYPFMNFFLRAPREQIRFDAIQSEEGGRFFQVRNRNMIVELPPEERLDFPGEYTWMTLRQIIDFTRHDNYVNIEARGLLSCMSFL